VSAAVGTQRALFHSDNLSVAARAAADDLRALGESFLVCSLARLIVYAFGARPWVRVSTRELRQRARDWGVNGWYGAPSYGAVVRVLTLLEARGWLTWERAWVPRHHGKLTWSEIERIEGETGERIIYPHRSECGEPRLPSRKLEAGPTLAKFLGIATRANLISDARSSGPSARPPREAEASARRASPSTAVASPIEPAPEAERGSFAKAREAFRAVFGRDPSGSA
jgi:hypothetical protein